MADNKILNTRIQLKHDTLANWQLKNTLLKKGEIAIAVIETVDPANKLHQPVMFKVGPGNFNDLEWASALAADVYAWAKKAGIDVIDNGTGNVVSDIAWNAASQALVVTRIDVYTKTEADKKFQEAGNYKTVQEEKVYTGSTVKTVTKVEQDTNGVITNVKFEDIAFPTIDTGVMSVELKTGSADKTLKLKVNGTEQADVEVKNIYSKSEVDALIEGAKDYADDNDTNTAHTHKDGSGIKVKDANGGIDGEVTLDLNVAFELSGNTIKLYDKDDTTKAAIATLDATNFIKDGMLNDVEYNAATNTLTFTWNTDAGTKTDTVVLSDILDPYVFEAGAKLDVAVEGTKVTYSHETVAAPTKTAGTGRTYITEVTTDGYGHITGYKTATESDQDLNGYKTKQTAVTDKITDKAHVLDSLTQNANGEISYTVKKLTPDDIGAQKAGNYKIVQDAVNDPTANGKSLTFIDTISQNTNGVITATKKNVNLDSYALKSEIPTDFGVTKITSTDTTTRTDDDNVSGLKITPATGTGTVNIEIDDTITFILDCGGAE